MEGEKQALTLQWAFGFSSEINNSVLVVSESGQDRICYPAAHTAVIYDWVERQQMVLQGHCNRITCMRVTEDKSCIITADAGDDAMVVMWETATGQPLRTIPNPHPAGVVALDISHDGQYLVLVSAPTVFETEEGSGAEQEISMWDLTEDGSLDTPAAVGSIPAGDLQTCVQISRDDSSEILSNGAQRVYFWKTQLPYSREFKYYSPPVSARDFKQAIGDFTVSVFVPGTKMAVTGTMDGDVVVWEEGTMPGEVGVRPNDRRAVKILRIHLEAAITTLTTVGRYIVSGGSDGCVRFYDARLRLAAWFDEARAGPITSISFATSTAPSMYEVEGIDPDAFSAPDFMLGTSQARIVAMKAASFARHDLPKGGEQVLEGTYGRLEGLAAHPMRAEYVVAGANGMLWVWSYTTKQLGVTRKFDTLRVNKLMYAPDGSALATGCTNGTVRILNPSTLEDYQAFRFTTHCCAQLAFSADCQTLAVADEGGFVSLVTYGHGRTKDKWEFIGKHGSHSGTISGLAFEGVGKSTRLFAVGEDGILAEYDLLNSSIGNGVRIVNHSDVGRGASVPTALAVAPPYLKSRTSSSLVITADTAFKFRMYDSTDQLCQKTVLGPTYGGPLEKMTIFQPAGSAADLCYLAYATREKVVGLSALPLDGNPHKAMGLIAHPGEVTGMAMTYDGRRMLTAGGDDSIVNLWAVDANVLEQSLAASAAEGNCYMGLLEGGQDGEFFQELKDYFYYSQIHSQGEDTTAPRNINGTVMLTMVPNLMRALGYYPSEAEVSDMMMELQAETPDATHVDFQGFIALYVNHRPVFGIGKDQLAAAFEALQAHPATGALEAEELVAALTSEGEPMSQAELEECLHALSGQHITHLHDIIPPSVDSKTFAEDVLGFEDYHIDVAPEQA